MNEESDGEREEWTEQQWQGNPLCDRKPNQRLSYKGYQADAYNGPCECVSRRDREADA